MSSLSPVSCLEAGLRRNRKILREDFKAVGTVVAGCSAMICESTMRTQRPGRVARLVGCESERAALKFVKLLSRWNRL